MSAQKWFRRFIWVLAACIIMVVRAAAQSDGTPYQVVGSQAVNARQCPQLDCAVVASLQPDTIVMVVDVVSGDTVFDSDQWVQVDADGTVMYVHSKLVEPAESESAPLYETDSDDEESDVNRVISTSIDTSAWIAYTDQRIELLAPRGWLNIVELAADTGFLNDLREMYGADFVDWIGDLSRDCKDGVYVLVLTEFEGSGMIYVERKYWTGTSITPRYLKRLIETRNVTIQGANLINSELVRLPAGDGVRVVTSFSDELTGSITANIIYGIIIGDEVYYLTLAVQAEHIDYYADMFDAVITSFDYDASNT
ncbi:MAG: hypothetical protein JNL42_14055 [Anaerolineae bacterium]|nr:hypothetical protein [Anaerolineae bacterium]